MCYLYSVVFFYVFPVTNNIVSAIGLNLIVTNLHVNYNKEDKEAVLIL